jgi:hypothetical protein
MLKFGHCPKQMTIERQKKLSKSAKKYVRNLKVEIRDNREELEAWEITLEILRLKIQNFDQEISAYTSTLYDFFKVRRQIRNIGWNQDLVRQFQENHKDEFEDSEVKKKLVPALTLITETVG